MAFERGPYSDIKKQNIFQICRGKFLKVFKENLDRVSPCPSTWHKNQARIQKFQLWDPFSALLLQIGFLAVNDILVESSFICHQIELCSKIKTKKHLDFIGKGLIIANINVSYLHN